LDGEKQFASICRTIRHNGVPFLIHQHNINKWYGGDKAAE